MSGRAGYSGPRWKLMIYMWKLMIYIRLERFFGLPIIPAPKRNSKLYNEMWTNRFLSRAFGRGPCARLLRGALTSDTPVSCDGQAPLLQRPLFTSLSSAVDTRESIATPNETNERSCRRPVLVPDENLVAYSHGTPSRILFSE